MRGLIVQGYRNEFSPEVLAVTKQPAVAGQVPAGSTGAALTWPSLSSVAATRVPIAFAGPGIPKGKTVDLGLDDIAPTLAKAIRLDWPYPTYRTGAAIEGARPSDSPLVVLIAWKGVGSIDIGTKAAAAPDAFRTLLRAGTGTLDGTSGSLPVDSTAALTTVGTGATPRVHGITGTLVRNAAHEVVPAWSQHAPYTVVNGFGDALDSTSSESASVGLVGTRPFDRGLIGGNWFQGLTDLPWTSTPWTDDDVVRVVKPQGVAEAVDVLLRSGAFGADATPDLLGVTLEGPVAKMNAATQKIIDTAQAAAGGKALIAVFGTGSASGAGTPNASTAEYQQAQHLVDAVDTQVHGKVIEAAIPGGLFLSRDTMTADSITSGEVVQASKAQHVNGQPVMADVFPAFAITLERFCDE